MIDLGTPGRHFACAEGGSRASQIVLNCRCERMRATHHAPSDPCSVLERVHGLAEIVERGGGVLVERPRVGWIYAQSLYNDDSATLDDLREAVTTLEEIERIARRVLGGAHPDVVGIETSLRMAREKLRARETPSTRA